MRHVRLLALVAGISITAVGLPTLALALLGIEPWPLDAVLDWAPDAQSPTESSGALTGRVAPTPSPSPRAIGSPPVVRPPTSLPASEPGVLVVASPTPSEPIDRTGDDRPPSPIPVPTPTPLPTPSPTATATATPSPTPSPTPQPSVAVALACRVTASDGVSTLAPTATTAPAVTCRWSADPAGQVATYRLWRVTDGDAATRRLRTTVTAGHPTRFTDLLVRRGHRYTYRVVALGKDGTRLGVSPAVTVRVPLVAETLDLGCAIVARDSGPAVACRWSASTRRSAVAYVVWRSVDGGPRERLRRIAIDGRRVLVDLEVVPGQRIRYIVAAVDRYGVIVGYGGPVRVLVPAVRIAQ